MRSDFWIISAVLFGPSTALSAQAPVVDYHQHLFSPAAAALVTGKADARGIGASDVIALLDSAHIRRALVLSVAYTWGKASRDPVAGEYEHVKAENDWTATQVSRYPDRLVAFCSFNPLKGYALEELERCSRDPQLQHGVKLHFGNSDVDLDDPKQVAQVRKIFAAANGHRMPIVVHMHTSLDMHRRYGADQARVFLDELLPAAPDVPVQIAHLAGSGGYDDADDAALGVFADAIARHDARTKNVWFDAAVVVRPDFTSGKLRGIAARMRQIGVDRILYGSDAAASPATYPKAGWAAFRRLPLTEAEFSTIANNVTPYMRSVAARPSAAAARACSANDTVAAAIIRDRLADWVAQTNRGDRTAANTIWAPNATGWFPRGPEFSDSAAFAAAGVPPTAGRPTVTYELQVDNVAVDGNLAVVHDIWKERRQFTEPAVTVTREIRGSEMWRCQSDGSWRIVRWVSAPEHWVRAR